MDFHSFSVQNPSQKSRTARDSWKTLLLKWTDLTMRSAVILQSRKTRAAKSPVIKLHVNLMAEMPSGALIPSVTAEFTHTHTHTRSHGSGSYVKPILTVPRFLGGPLAWSPDTVIDKETRFDMKNLLQFQHWSGVRRTSESARFSLETRISQRPEGRVARSV